MELSVIDKKLAMDSRDIATLTHKSHKLFIIYSKYEYKKYVGDEELPIYDELYPEGDILFEDSRSCAITAKREHKNLLETIAKYCNCNEMVDSDFVMMESNLMSIMLYFTIVREILSREQDGFVYILFDDTNLNVKIGKAKDVEKRLRSLKCANPNLKLYGYMKCKNHSKVENLLHKRFKMGRISGEFFLVDPKTAFDELCKLHDEYGYKEVNPVCIEASGIVTNVMQKRLICAK